MPPWKGRGWIPGQGAPEAAGPAGLRPSFRTCAATGPALNSRPHEGFPRLRLELGKLAARVGRRFREKAWARLFNTMTVVTLLNGSR